MTVRRGLATMLSSVVVLGLVLLPARMAQAADSDVPTVCGGVNTPAPPVTKQINIVIDDSGSMFFDGRRPLDRWSFAKYSLEVFAALMEPQDTLNVYLMSSFADGIVDAEPVVQLSGAEDSTARVAKIHGMQMAGGGTPYAPVRQASADLSAASADRKWLVILTDGEFQNQRNAQISASAVSADLRDYVASNPNARVVVLAVGGDATSVPGDPAAGIYSYQAKTSGEVLTRMRDLSNMIFQRVVAPGVEREWRPDVPLEQAVVFAQGKGVRVGSVATSSGSQQPDSVVTVQWATNPPVDYDDRPVQAVPNQELQGQLATFSELPMGDLTFDIPSQDAVVSVFYKPKVNFGIKLLDEAGQEIRPEDPLTAGQYTVEYGFMNENCEIIESELLGDVEYTASISQNGNVVAQGVQPGEIIDLDTGDVSFDVQATYLNNLTSSAQIKRTAAPLPTSANFEIGNASFPVSELAEFPPASQALSIGVEVMESRVTGKTSRPITPEEWEAFDPSTVTFDSPSNLEFAVLKGEAIGQILLLPRAPGGDVYAADTGRIDVTIVFPRLSEGGEQGIAPVQVEVIDDLSALDRFLNWWRTIGWKLLLLLLLIILILGYIFKRRFSKRMKRRPTISGVPNQIGMSAEEGAGKFRVNGARRFLPFVADTATLTYVPPGVSGFRAMKLKAGPRKTMIVANWRQIAERGNTEINGLVLDENTRRAPTFGPSATITASTPRMTYDLTPSA